MDANIVTTQFTSAALVVYALQKLKSARWFPWLRAQGQLWLKRGISIGAALGIHTGITHIWNPGTEPGWHVLVITIPPATIVAVGLWHWLGQYAMQETLYQAVANKTTPAL